MKKSHVLLNLFLLFTSVVLAQTNVLGIISSDTTWTLENSPYNIVGNVGVTGSSVLTIEEGVVVNFKGNYEILVYGSTQILGTIENKIVFNGNSTGGSGTKKMLEFGQTNLSNSSIKYVTFNGAQDALLISRNEVDYESSSEEKAQGTLIMDNCTFNSTRLQTDGYNSKGKLLIKNSSFENTLVKGRYPNSEIIELDNCNIKDSSLFSDSYHNGFILRNSVVEYSTLTIGCCGEEFQIDFSKLSDCEFVADNDHHKLNISNSILYNTSIVKNYRSWYTDQDLKLTNSTYITDDYDKYIQYQNIEISGCNFIGDNVNKPAVEATDELSVINSNFIDWNDALLIGGEGSITSSNFINTINSYIKLTSNEDTSVSDTFFETNPMKSFSEMVTDQNDNLRLGKVAISNNRELINADDCPTLPPTDLILTKQKNLNYKLTWNDLEGYKYKLYLNKINNLEYEDVIDLGSNIKEYLISDSDRNDFALTAYKDENSNQLNGGESWYISSYEVQDENSLSFGTFQISNEIEVLVENKKITVSSKSVAIKKLTVYDLYGRTLKVSDGNTIVLDGSIIGVSLLKIETSKGITVEKIMN